MNRMKSALAICLGVVALLMPRAAHAQSDEIQVYTGGLAPVGVFNLTWHNNYTPDGIDTPAFSGAIKSNKSFNGVTEWAYGVTRWFEAGLYLPLYSHDESLGWQINGFKLRTLFAVPDADDRRFVYGANYEFSVNEKHWDDKRITSEVRPIVGWHLGAWDLIANPIVDTRYDGLKNLEFVPSARVAYNASKTWAYAAEWYADFGTFADWLPAGEQAHQIYAVLDYTGPLEVEAGVGYGLTDASDRWQVKVIVARDLNHPKTKK